MRYELRWLAFAVVSSTSLAAAKPPTKPSIAILTAVFASLKQSSQT